MRRSDLCHVREKKYKSELGNIKFTALNMAWEFSIQYTINKTLHLHISLREQMCGGLDLEGISSCNILSWFSSEGWRWRAEEACDRTVADSNTMTGKRCVIHLHPRQYFVAIYLFRHNASRWYSQYFTFSTFSLITASFHNDSNIFYHSNVYKKHYIGIIIYFF